MLRIGNERFENLELACARGDHDIGVALGVDRRADRVRAGRGGSFAELRLGGEKPNVHHVLHFLLSFRVHEAAASGFAPACRAPRRFSGWGGGGANHQFGRDDHPLRLGAAALENLAQQGDGLRTRFGAMGRDRRQGRIGSFRQHIVEPDDAHVARHLETAIGKPRHDALRHQVVERHRRGDVGPQQFIRRILSALIGRVKGRHGHKREVLRLRGLHRRLLALLVGPGGGRPAHIGDAAVPEIGQMGDGLRDTRFHIHENPRQPVDIAVDEDQRAARRMGADALLVETRRREDEAVHLRGDLGEENVLPLRFLVGIAEEDREARLVGARLRGADQRRKERIGDVGNDQRDVAGAPGAQGPRDLVGDIAEPRRDRAHSFGGFGREELRPAEGPRDGRARHAGGGCHLGDRRHPVLRRGQGLCLPQRKTYVTGCRAVLSSSHAVTASRAGRSHTSSKIDGVPPVWRMHATSSGGRAPPAMPSSNPAKVFAT